MEEMVYELVSRHSLHYYKNIVPGHTRAKVRWKRTVLLAPIFHGASFHQVRYLFFYFTKEHLGLFEYSGKKLGGIQIMIPWKELSGVKIRIGKLEDDLSFLYDGNLYEMKLTRRMRGQTWVEENIENLEMNGFYYR